MTREEAIVYLKRADVTVGKEIQTKTAEALDLAIKALEQEPTSKNDLAVSSELENESPIIDWNNCHTSEQLNSISTSKNDLGVDVHDNNVGNIDCISRADAIDSIAVECSAENLDIDYAKFLMLKRAIKALPAVISQEPRSEWEQDHAILKVYSDGANEVLDKIRAEIEEHAKINQNLNTDRAKALCWCLDVIDKYKAESEEV